MLVFKSQKNKDNLFLILSPSVTISVSTINQVNIRNVPENITIELVKEEYRQVGLHKLLRKTVIHLSYAAFLQLKSSTDSIHFSLNIVGNHVKCPIEAVDKRQQHQDSEPSTTPKPRIPSGKEDHRLSEQIFNEFKHRDDVVEIAIFPSAPRNRKKQYRITLKQSDNFNICFTYL